MHTEMVFVVISSNVGEMVHLVINCVQKTKTIQVFFLKIAVSSEYQKGCVVVSFEVNRRCSVLFHYLIDCWTYFNNLRLLIVYQSVMLEFIHFFRHKRCHRNSYWYFHLHTVTTNLAYLSEILYCSFHVAAAALSFLNEKKLHNNHNKQPRLTQWTM